MTQGESSERADGASNEPSSSPRGFQGALDADNELLSRERWTYRPTQSESVAPASSPVASVGIDGLGVDAGNGTALIAGGIVGVTTLAVLLATWLYLRSRGPPGAEGRKASWSDWWKARAAAAKKKRKNNNKKKRKKKNRGAGGSAPNSNETNGDSSTAVIAHSAKNQDQVGVQSSQAPAATAITSVESSVVNSVTRLTTALGIDPKDLDPTTKLQLIQTAVHTEALKLRHKETSLTESMQRMTSRKEDRKSLERRTGKFKTSLSDALVAGILVVILCLGWKILNFSEQWRAVNEACAPKAGTGGALLSGVSLFFDTSVAERALCLCKALVTRFGGYAVLALIGGRLCQILGHLALNYQR